jgi:hypothetical protein
MPDLQSIKKDLHLRAISAFVWAAATFIARSTRLQEVGGEKLWQRWKKGEPSILVTWHGRTLIPIWLFGPRRFLAMISLSNDGEYQNRIFRRFGWDVVRGSTGRGGVRALATTVRAIKEGATLAFTPDGPRGPSHVVNPGVLFMAQKAQCPIYPIGVSAYPRWFLPTWDRYLIPCPFSRAVVIYGEPLFVPPGATQADLRQMSADLSRRICEVETEAEARVTPEQYRQLSTPAEASPAENSAEE